MLIVTVVVAVTMVLVGVAGVAYAALRGAGQAQRPAAVVAVATVPLTCAGVLALPLAPDLASGLGTLLGALGLAGCAWWLWQRRPVVQVAAQAATWTPAQDVRTAKLRAGMRGAHAGAYADYEEVTE